MRLLVSLTKCQEGTGRLEISPLCVLTPWWLHKYFASPQQKKNDICAIAAQIHSLDRSGALHRGTAEAVVRALRDPSQMRSAADANLTTKAKTQATTGLICSLPKLLICCAAHVTTHPSCMK